jgi:tripartite-type tricarboxylate transporter receptor subunit TctC
MNTSALILMAALAGPAAAQGVDFPSRALRLVVPFPPGGSNDIVGRFVALRLSERLGQPVVVDNRAGADGIIGTELVARAEPDGYTLLIVSSTYTMNPAIHKLPYDPVKSLAPVARLASGGNVIAVTPSLPVSNIRELIALAKTKAGHVRYASSGIGGFNHFGGELFNMLAGVSLEHVPYKGGGPSMVDVMGGQVEVVFGTLIQALPHIRSGKLKALGVGSAKRSPLLPEVPTVSEAGVPGYDGSIWWGILTRAGAPTPIIAKLNTEINAVLRDPETAKRLAAEGAEPVTDTPEAFGKLIAAELVKWERIARQARIRAE